VTVLPKRYVFGPLLSRRTIVFPGVNEVIVPPPSVVVVVVVSETCAHANGAATAKATLNSNFFIVSFLLVFPDVRAVRVRQTRLPLHIYFARD